MKRLSVFKRYWLALITFMVTVPLAALVAVLTDARWLVYALAAVCFVAALYPVLARCPRCNYRVQQKSGEWPFAMPKDPHDPLCAKCGLDLRTV